MQVKELDNKKQREIVLEHLKDYGTLTQLEALQRYGIGRLSARVKRLRDRGHQIATDQDGPHDYATYRLIEEAD